MNEGLDNCANDVAYDVASMDEVAISQLNPRVKEAIEAIKAEKSGDSPISWSEFSSHNQK